MLQLAKQNGHVYVVTNAVEGWVEKTAQRYLPNVHQILNNGIKVISARSKFEQHYPNNKQMWKVHAFLETGADMTDRETITNLIVVGDSLLEIEAAQILGAQF